MTRFRMRCTYPRHQLLTASKNLQREQSSLSSEKELKSNALHTVREEISRKSIRLGELRTKQEKHRMDELALKEQREELTNLQAQLKVRSFHY